MFGSLHKVPCSPQRVKKVHLDFCMGLAHYTENISGGHNMWFSLHKINVVRSRPLHRIVLRANSTFITHLLSETIASQAVAVIGT